MRRHQPAVIARVRGGLGNQLFIYATARALALRNHVPLRLDTTSGFERDGYRRTYLLDRFAITAEPALPSERFSGMWGRFRRAIRLRIEQSLPSERRTLLVESDRAFQSWLKDLRVTRSITLDGLWQSERYFDDAREVLLKELVLRQPLLLRDQPWLEQIESCVSVAVHGRSYREVPPQDDDGSGHVAPAYYHRAMAWMRRRLGSVRFFCFSDDTAWFRRHLGPVPDAVFVDATEEDPLQGALRDLWLMSRCGHQIIASSTFSWWAAWLNPNPHKLVVAPGGAWNNPDYIPKTWLILSAERAEAVALTCSG